MAGPPRLPAHLRGDLFEAVQRSDVFEDSKTYVDCLPRTDPEAVVEHYRARRDEPGFDLETFVEEFFVVPAGSAESPELPADRTMETHVDLLWDHLTHDPDVTRDSRGSLLWVPKPFVTPGGRFRELFYWDTYFTAVGLPAAGRTDQVADLADNFRSLVERFGFVPNATREYFLSRSQPPTFALLVDLLEAERGPAAVEPYLDALEAEHDFWMDGLHGVTVTPAARRRVVNLDSGVLNRYWDDRAEPREESYREDLALAARVDQDPSTLYRHLRAACESGWDFSGRWCRTDDLATIRTADLVPVDLNALLYAFETRLAKWFGRSGEREKARGYAARANTRREAIAEYCFDPEAGYFFDYCWTEGERTDEWTLAPVATLFCEVCVQDEADAVAATLRERFLHEGGLVTTLTRTGEQWDSPNGWAPLHYMAVVGLEKYGHDELAREIAERWVGTNRRVFERTGKMLEKYDVVDTDRRAGGGEYPLQDGFGWTNGVAVALLDRYDGL